MLIPEMPNEDQNILRTLFLNVLKCLRAHLPVRPWVLCAHTPVSHTAPEAEG